MPQVFRAYPFYMPEGATIVDWGCGTLAFTKEYARYRSDLQWLGVDHEPVTDGVLDRSFDGWCDIDPAEAHVCISRNVLEHLVEPRHVLCYRRIENEIIITLAYVEPSSRKQGILNSLMDTLVKREQADREILLRAEMSVENHLGNEVAAKLLFVKAYAGWVRLLKV